MAFSTGREVRDRSVLLRVRRPRRSHEIMIPRSAAERQKVNSRKADEFPGRRPGSPCHDSLDVSFGAVYGFKESFLNRAAYEALRSRGFDLISDDSLRVHIIRLYDEDYREVEVVDERHRSSVMELYRPYFLERFVGIDFNNSTTPLDYLALLRNQYFINLIEYCAAQLQLDTGPAYDTAVVRSSALPASIDEALDGVRD
jgi:hypothetical protein